MSEALSVTTITERRTQWLETVKNLQQRGQELTRELNQVQDQLSQLNGAIQACDIFLNGVPQTDAPETTTLEE